jgi:hypothetical protein
MKPFFKRFLNAIRHESERERWEQDFVDRFNEIYSHVSEEGGILTVLNNNTGAASIKGTLVQASTAADNSFQLASTTGYAAIGVVYDNDVPAGQPCRIVVSGVADVLLQDGIASTRGNWIHTSTTIAGRADADENVPSPPTADAHFKEVGHCLQSVTAGTDKLCRAIIHFN